MAALDVAADEPAAGRIDDLAVATDAAGDAETVGMEAVLASKPDEAVRAGLGADGEGDRPPFG